MDNKLAREFHTGSLIRFALPNIVMMVFMSLYTIVDGMFISRLVGTLALSAVNMSYPLSSLQLALGIMLGTGGSAVIAREMGEGKDALAREDFSCIVAVALGTGVVFALAGNFFLGPILELLGTSEVQMPYTVEYTRILLWFAPAMFLQTVFQVLFVTAGKPTLGGRNQQCGAGLSLHGAPSQRCGRRRHRHRHRLLHSGGGRPLVLLPAQRQCPLVHPLSSPAADAAANLWKRLFGNGQQYCNCHNHISLQYSISPLLGRGRRCLHHNCHVFSVRIHSGVLRLFHGGGPGDQL